MVLGATFLFGALFGLTILGIPIVFAMGLASVFYIVLFGSDISFSVVAQRLIGGVDSFSLLAVPFFFLSGELMNAGGITNRLVDFSRGLVGGVRGGLSYVVIVSNMIMAGISGSCTADASATGSVLIPAMQKEGYEAEYAAALVAAASTIGPIIPPSILMIIYAVIANASVGRLFLAGAFPGVLMGIYLMIFSYVISKRRNHPIAQRVPMKAFVRSLVDTSLSLAIPAFVIGGIVGGVVTATEAGVIAVLASFLVGCCVYKELRLRELPRILGTVGVSCGLVLIIVGGGSAFGWILANMGIGDFIVQLFLSISTNKWVILALINVFLLFLGCFVEPLTALVIFGPIFVSLAQHVGLDLVHFGLVVVLNLILGNLTPPVGMLLYITATIARVPVERVVVRVMPFFGALVIVLAIVSFWPAFVLFLPNLLMGR